MKKNKVVKKIMLFRLLLSLIVIFSASSCGSDDILEEPVLNPEEKPKEKPVLVPEKKTDPLDPIDINPGLIESSLQGLLKGLGDDQMFNNNGYRTIWGDTSVDIYSVPDFARDIDLQTYTQLPTYRLFDQAWTQHYFYIGRANEVIKKWGDFALDADNPAVNSKLNELVSTAYYIRAMLYFNLVKIFEKPTILSLDTPTTVEDVLSAESTGNATPKQVYDIIIEDLKTVSRIAEDTSNNQTVTKMGAEGLLGRVYLQIAGILNHNFVVDKSIYNFDKPAEGFYNLAIDQFDIVINSGKYSLLENYADIFNPEKEGVRNTEMIYAIPFASDGNGGGSNFGEAFGVRGGPPNGGFLEREYFFDFIYSFFDDVDNIPVTGFGAPSFPLKISDSRFLATFATFSVSQFNNSESVGDIIRNIFIGSFGPYKLRKPFPSSADSFGDYNVDFPYLRYADILLMKAEAQIKLNKDLDKARDYINQVRRRAYRFGINEAGKNTADLVQFDTNGDIIFEGVTDKMGMTKAFHNVQNLEAWYNGNLIGGAVEDIPTIAPGTRITGIQPGFEGEIPPAGTTGLEVDLPNLSADQLFEALMRERRKEFAGEGLRKDTLIRNGILDDVVLAIGNGIMSPFSSFHTNPFEVISQRSGGKKASDGYAPFKYRWPIPQNQLDIDNKLTQNSGY